jgi:hypothetical protein
MDAFGLARTVSQEDFIKGTAELLGVAGDYSVDTQKTIDAAEQVLVVVDKVQKGELAIQPPLEDGKLKEIEQRAHDNVVFGEKALIGLDTSRRGRSRLSRVIAQQATSRLASTELVRRSASKALVAQEQTFRGNGSDSKS